MSHSQRFAPRPPYSTGQDTAEYRAACSFFSHSTCRAKPSAVSPLGSGSVGTLASSHARTSWRNASSLSVKVRSITVRILGLEWRATMDHRLPHLHAIQGWYARQARTCFSFWQEGDLAGSEGSADSKIPSGAKQK